MNVETLVVTDLDGTLWFDGEECHAASLDAIGHLATLGVPLLVATGRRLRSVDTAFHKHGFKGQAILLNGSLGYCFDEMETFFERGFPTKNENRIREIFRICELSPCFYADDSYVYAASPTTSKGHLEAIGSDLVELANLDLFPDKRKILNFCILGIEKPRLDEAEGLISSEGLGTVAYYEDSMFGNHSIMVQPPATSKWSGVQEWCKHYDVNPRKIIAVGDAGNDFELLEGADLAVVVEGAEQYLIDLADEIIQAPSRGGWAEVINFL